MTETALALQIPEVRPVTIAPPDFGALRRLIERNDIDVPAILSMTVESQLDADRMVGYVRLARTWREIAISAVDSPKAAAYKLHKRYCELERQLVDLADKVIAYGEAGVHRFNQEDRAPWEDHPEPVAGSRTRQKQDCEVVDPVAFLIALGKKLEALKDQPAAQEALTAAVETKAGWLRAQLRMYGEMIAKVWPGIEYRETKVGRIK